MKANTIILNLDREIKRNNMEIARLRKENAECKFCAEMLKRIERLCKDFRLAAMEIEILTTVGSERAMMIESLLEAYTYELAKMKAECVLHRVSNEMVSMIFDGLGM